MNRWNKSLHAGTKSQNLTVDSMIFGCGQKWLWPFFNETLRSAVF